ncbi:PPOX class F420-dependent oxidoreductase [Cryptosporangium aurantiacum]|uniref:Pyridoxamine 5'-phosphate oxidase family protein n=1 Tax=Cryptosporangium aurantiacum TaxID=134849 RepID=A0A1M7RNR8_9ACTN|nr:PPOX class F420-dependent oxidoreductase [Cryptosporangium aurantiacum]SHN47746.1 pyridoxamine 5'-phosphate oxidase family protein [Cryptosporangium aurantiacum]
MTFTSDERQYLAAQRRGHLGTIGPDGTPQVKPVAYFWDADAETIDIGGPELSRSQKSRNVEADPRVSFVVDDESATPVGPGGQRGRGLEIRGTAVLLSRAEALLPGFSPEVLRIRPRRVVAWNIDGPGANIRDVVAG